MCFYNSFALKCGQVGKQQHSGGRIKQISMNFYEFQVYVVSSRTDKATQ